MAWIGPAQTVATISRSVTTVAGGLMSIESRLIDFMRKVAYYDKFFERRKKELPEAVTRAARRLVAKCHEYKVKIRGELDSNVGYVVDAGRWVVGLDDWNMRMDRRFSQLLELVLLANSLLAEYSITGQIEPEGSSEELSGYISAIMSMVTLSTDTTTPYYQSAPSPSKRPACPPVGGIVGGGTGTPSTLRMDANSPCPSMESSTSSLLGDGIEPSGGGGATKQSQTTKRLLEAAEALSGLEQAENEDGAGRELGEDCDHDVDSEDKFNPFAKIDNRNSTKEESHTISSRDGVAASGLTANVLLFDPTINARQHVSARRFGTGASIYAASRGRRAGKIESTAQGLGSSHISADRWARPPTGGGVATRSHSKPLSISQNIILSGGSAHSIRETDSHSTRVTVENKQRDESNYSDGTSTVVTSPISIAHSYLNSTSSLPDYILKDPRSMSTSPITSSIEDRTSAYGDITAHEEMGSG